MRQLRSGFYIDLPVEGDATKADIDGLALEFMGNVEGQSSNHLSGTADPSFGIEVADSCYDGLLPAAGMKVSSNPEPFSKQRRPPTLSTKELRYWRSMPAGGTVMQAALMDSPSTQSCERYDLSTLARQHLEHHPHFRGRVSDVFIEHRDRTLVLTGKLPTFYLKQLVQEAVRHVPGVQHVRNLIDVVSASGISSVRC
jgi:BON domain-containing protein